MHQVPQIPLQINWGHPLARGLLEFGYALDGKTPYSAFQKTLPYIDGSSSPDASAHGRAIKVASSPNSIVLGRNFSAPTQVASGFVLTRVNSLAEAAMLLATSAASTNYAGHSFFVGTTGAITAYWGDNLGSDATTNRRNAASGTGLIAAGETVALGFTCRAAADWSLYKNGLSQTPAYSGSASTYAPGTFASRINYRAPQGPLYGQQSVSAWGFWGRALSDAEMALLALDPFCLLRVRRDPAYYVAAAAGGADVRSHIIPAYMRIAA